MSKAVRAIIMNDGKLLAMHRNKYGSEYFTLVGGRVNQGETLEHALAREVKEETGLTITSARLVFTEQYPEPYNEQYIYLCEVVSTDSAAVQEFSEEGQMNRLGMNIHNPVWLETRSFAGVQFRTPVLHKALVNAMKQGWPKEPVRL